MRFCVLFGFIFHFKKNRFLKKNFITAHHSSSLNSTMAGSSSSSQKYVALDRTLFTPVDKLEVYCESFVNFESLADNGLDFRSIVEFQGWEKFFDRLLGLVFPTLVKEFLIHAFVYPKVVVSSVMGTKFMVTELLIKQLIGYEHDNVEYVPPARRNMEEIYAEVFVSGEHSNKIKDLKPHYKIWAKIFIGCIFHRKITNSLDYINNEQIYMLYCIGTNRRIDLPHVLFDHLCTQVKETREDGKNKNRMWIGMGRLLSDILTESGLVDHLYEAGQAEILKATVGKPLDGRSLFRLKLIDEVKAEPHDISQDSIKKRRVKVQDFPLWTREEPVESLLYFIESCKRDGIPLPPDLLEQASRPAPKFEVRKKRKLKKKKVVAESEEPRQKKKKMIIRNKGTCISETYISESIAIDPTMNHPHTTTETTTVSEQTSDQNMVDTPEQNKFVPEKEVSEQTVYVSENIIPETIPSVFVTPSESEP